GLVDIGPIANGMFNVHQYGGFTGPVSFGTNIGNIASTGSGDTVGLLAAPMPPGATVSFIDVPLNYVSGAPLSDIATFNNTTISGLFLTPGTYIWTWGTGAHQGTFTLDIIGPSAVPGPIA